MKILIAYATKSGTAAKCASMLAAELPAHEVVLHDLDTGMPDIAGYDFIAVGGSVRMGKLHKKMSEFMSRRHGELAAARTGYFICCGYTDSAQEYIEKNIPADLRASAAVCACFGGELNVKAQKGVDRFILRMIVGSVLDDGKDDGELKTANLPSIMPESIGRFAEVIKASFARSK